MIDIVGIVLSGRVGKSVRADEEALGKSVVAFNRDIKVRDVSVR